MGEEEVKLLGTWFSPYVHRVAWVLKQKGIRYELCGRNGKQQELSPSGLQPRVQEDPSAGSSWKPIVESLFIIEYIDETWKHNPILSTHPYDRAMERFWALYVDQMNSNLALRHPGGSSVPRTSTPPPVQSSTSLMWPSKGVQDSEGRATCGTWELPRLQRLRVLAARISFFFTFAGLWAVRLPLFARRHVMGTKQRLQRPILPCPIRSWLLGGVKASLRPAPPLLGEPRSGDKIGDLQLVTLLLRELKPAISNLLPYCLGS
ncbi:hypothetical protein CXB51_008416 [Gossypium anomalum]|uniref:GST N-terminal domain-containing protein n=1 Tax=Gossypium anomalum TaxID=47600 RepID=A0A8J5ZAR0_9ROSI|nr:hypothetical protein CXB51_008416 [Gossypium anomalum]